MQKKRMKVQKRLLRVSAQKQMRHWYEDIMDIDKELAQSVINCWRENYEEKTKKI